MSRLSRFSGSRIEMGSDQDTIKVTGSESERKLARLCIDITDAQRTNQGRDVNFEAIEARDDCVVIQVPTVAVGFVMGCVMLRTNICLDTCVVFGEAHLANLAYGANFMWI